VIDGCYIHILTDMIGLIVIFVTFGKVTVPIDFSHLNTDKTISIQENPAE